MQDQNPPKCPQYAWFQKNTEYNPVQTTGEIRHEQLESSAGENYRKLFTLYHSTKGLKVKTSSYSDDRPHASWLVPIASHLIS